ncbi:MAG TPA: ParB N-terminal domain-containing protein [Polyangiaceae bacterium]|jgi:ParB family chromosome partitioning protein
MAAKKKRVTKKAKTKALVAPTARAAATAGTDLAELRARIEGDEGAVIGTYADPFGGKPLLVALLPIEKVEPTPFQRDVSDSHEKKLENVIAKTGRFLDPIVCVTAPKGGYWTPNGNHRLQAMKELGAKSITALVVPEHEVAWQILALNTERAHNLKERSLEVIRIYRSLLEERGDEAEQSFDFYLEDPALITLGAVYEKNARFAGGAYQSVLRRAERFSSDPISKAIRAREKTAALLGELEEKVSDIVKRLREKGLTSPYLRPFVVARINPLRFSKSEPPPIDEVLTAMRDKAAKFNVDKVRQQDLMGASGPPPEE